MHPRKIYSSFLCLGICFNLALVTEVTATVDQQSTLANSAFGPSTAAGQSFTPSLSGIDFATFSLSVSSAAASVSAVLFAGSGYAGALLATSAPQLVTTNSFQSYQFNFSSTVSLTPGQVYTLQLNVTSGSIFELDGNGNPYAGGQEFSSAGVAQPTFDLVFSEGVNAAPGAVPEHGDTAILLGLSALILLCLSRRSLVLQRSR